MPGATKEQIEKNKSIRYYEKLRETTMERIQTLQESDKIKDNMEGRQQYTMLQEIDAKLSELKSDPDQDEKVEEKPEKVQPLSKHGGKVVHMFKKMIGDEIIGEDGKSSMSNYHTEPDPRMEEAEREIQAELRKRSKNPSPEKPRLRRRN